MKNIIIIENTHQACDIIIGYLGACYFGEELKIDSEDWCKEMRGRLINVGFLFWEFTSNKKFLETYPEKLPDNTLIVLNDELTDGSPKQIFHLFSPENKKMTLIQTENYKFVQEVSKKDFSNFLRKTTGQENLIILGKKILELIQQIKTD